MLKEFYNSAEYQQLRRQKQRADFTFGLSLGFLVGSYSLAAQLVW